MKILRVQNFYPSSTSHFGIFQVLRGDFTYVEFRFERVGIKTQGARQKVVVYILIEKKTFYLSCPLKTIIFNPRTEIRVFLLSFPFFSNFNSTPSCRKFDCNPTPRVAARRNYGGKIKSFSFIIGWQMH